MKGIKLIVLFIVLNSVVSCNKKMNEKPNIFDLVEKSETKVSDLESKLEKFDSNIDVSFSTLIKCNMPFKLVEGYELILYFNNEMVYVQSIDNRIKIPNSFKDGDMINVSIALIDNENIYKLNNKYTFILSKEIKYYYLSFLPFNDSVDNFIVIPSNQQIS